MKNRDGSEGKLFKLNRFVYSWMRPERITLIIMIISLMRDKFQVEYGIEKSFWVLIAHLAVIIVCIFADTIKKKFEQIDLISVGNVKLEDTRDNQSIAKTQSRESNGTKE
jgi:hypothetical protein